MQTAPRMHDAEAALPQSVVVGVVGAGTMGSGIAQVAATAGHRVLLLDARPGAAAAAIATLRAGLARLVDKGRLDAAQASAAGERLQAVEELEQLACCGLVVEAIVEELEPKRQLLRSLEALLADEAILASNTSSISLTAIAAALRRPQRVAGLHFFNPAPVLPLVEVVAGMVSAPEVLRTLLATATAWGKTPVLASSTPGFIVNRVARPFYGEALRLAGERAADPATIDAVCRDCGGFRMGPFEVMDLIGLDVNLAVTRSVWEGFFRDPRFTPSLMQQELVAAGHLGRKSGRGFHDYREGAGPAAPAHEPAHPLPSRIEVLGASPAAAALAERLAERGVAFSRGPGDGERIALADGATLYLSDGRTATRRAAESSVAASVVVDLARDYRSATRLAIAPALQCPPRQAQAAAGLLQGAGYTVSRLADTPGLVLMRTVAMLANEAADAVQQGVCSAAAVDTAMRLGTNYPLGPLAWADALGVRQVVGVLDHLAAAYGEDRYRVSPYLRQRALAGWNCHE